MIDNPTYTIEMNALTMVSLVTVLELSLRHLENPGPVPILAKNAARQMATILQQHTALLFPELIDAWKKTGILPQNINEMCVTSD